jgi:hypothetical protein
MTSDTQILRILQHFGGDKRIELHSRLKSLVKLVERETRKRQYVEQPTVTTVLELDLDTTATPPEHTKLTETDFTGNSEYNRTMAIIHRLNYADWQHITEIPDDLFNTFYIIAELHPEIEFDSERDYQYFRVNGFTRRRA